MPSRSELRTALRDVQTFDHRSLAASDRRALVDRALGLLYEAYAQVTLDERGLNVDVSGVCGFVRYVNVIPVNAARSLRPDPVAAHPNPPATIAA